MNEKKDFKYEAQKPVIVNNDDVEEIEPTVGENPEYHIHDVNFLVSAVVDVGFGRMSSCKKEVSVDLANRRVYCEGKLAPFSDDVFEHLDRVNTLPEDFFQAGEDIYSEANKAVSDMEDIRKSTLEEGEE